MLEGRQYEWARVRTERTLHRLTRLPVYDSIRATIRGFATAAGAPLGQDLSIRGDYIDQVQRGPAHPRGVSRRTTAVSYLAGNRSGRYCWTSTPCREPTG